MPGGLGASVSGARFPGGNGAVWLDKSTGQPTSINAWAQRVGNAMVGFKTERLPEIAVMAVQIAKDTNPHGNRRFTKSYERAASKIGIRAPYRTTRSAAGRVTKWRSRVTGQYANSLVQVFDVRGVHVRVGLGSTVRHAFWQNYGTIEHAMRPAGIAIPAYPRKTNRRRSRGGIWPTFHMTSSLLSAVEVVIGTAPEWMMQRMAGKASGAYWGGGQYTGDLRGGARTR